MVIAELMEQTEKFLRATVPGDQSLDAKMRRLIEVERHELLTQGLEPKPLLKFLARVEDLLIEHDLL